MAFGAELQLPNTLLLVLHVVGLVLGAWLARTIWSKWTAGGRNVAYFFGAFAVSELLYVAAHTGWAAVSFAHQVGQILMWLGALAAVYGLWSSRK